MSPFRIIAGSGRSGTTWVLDVIAESNYLRPIFEPLGPLRSRNKRYAYRFISECEELPALKKKMESIRIGSYRSLWSDYRMPPSRLYPGVVALSSTEHAKVYWRYWKKLYKNYLFFRDRVDRPEVIAKFIRANLMLGWLSRNFNTRIVMLLRHPGAVVESQLRLGPEEWDPYLRLEQYKSDASLQSCYLKQYCSLLSQSMTPAQAHTVNWCIENQIPLYEAKTNGYVIVFYESLMENPEKEWNRIVQGLGLKNVPKKELIGQASQQASIHWSRCSSAKNNYTLWRERMDKKTLDEVAGIMQAMNVSVYDPYDPLPRFERFYTSPNRNKTREE